VGWRFYRRARIMPGVHLNWSRSGPSVSVGIRGAHVTFGKRGITRTVGLPGTGVFYTSREGWHSGVHTHALASPPIAAATPAPTAHGRRLWIVVFLAALLAFSALALWSELHP
jgi:Protein of unknown function (DUF4236)